MSDVQPFALPILIVAGLGLAAVLSNQLTSWTRIPAPALFLAAAALAVKFVPSVTTPSERTVQRIVSVALVLILFDGGMHIGWSRLRVAVGPIGAVGVIGTFLTAAAAATLVHYAFDVDWYLSLLVGTAVAPTDPAVVFSVLGQHEVEGRTGTILEGEAGANDPVGIALMVGLIGAGGLGWNTAAHVGVQFALQMGIGLAVGVLGGWAVLLFIRHVPLPSEALYPLRTAACAFILFGVAAVAHGSGFLAVFVAGVILGDGRVPHKREIQQFHSALASLGEIVAFVVLGLTVNVSEIAHTDVWLPGLILGVALVLVIRPLLVGLCLIPAGLPSNERKFVLFSGLKGAVPILLGSYLLAAHVTGAARLYGIVVVVVLFSVLVQGSLVPAVARALRVSMQLVSSEPWGLDVALREEPAGVYRFSVASGSPADGSTVGGLPGFPTDAWVSLIIRKGQLLAIRGGTVLQEGDDVLVLADEDESERLAATFEQPEGPVATSG
jgi:cell volume regulation protein A